MIPSDRVKMQKSGISIFQGIFVCVCVAAHWSPLKDVDDGGKKGHRMRTFIFWKTLLLEKNKGEKEEKPHGRVAEPWRRKERFLTKAPHLYH